MNREKRRPMHPYLELVKARLSLLVVATTAAGFALATRDAFDPDRFFWTILGTGLAAAGAAGFNQWIEVLPDSRMQRTRTRPLPAGTLSRRHGFFAALLAAASGVAVLAAKVNLLTAGLGLLVILLYTLVYTPLKRSSPLCTIVGAVCGAIPPVMGWTGGTGGFGLGGWILGGILFLWQIPHFLALAWLYREDYARGGFRMLPAIDPTGRVTSLLALTYIVPLLPLCLFLVLLGLAGPIFLAGSLVLGTAFLLLAVRLWRDRDPRHARRLFLGSIVYLPLLLILLLADRGPAVGMAAAEIAIGPAPVAETPPARAARPTPASAATEPPARAVAPPPARDVAKPPEGRGRGSSRPGAAPNPALSLPSPSGNTEVFVP